MLNPLQGTLGHRRAAHLLRRTCFHFTKTRIDQLAAMTVGQAMDELLKKNPLRLEQPIYDDPSTDPVENIEWLLPIGLDQPNQGFILQQWLFGWWVNEALHDEGIAHKMTLFWHQNFITDINTLPHEYFFDYLRILRYYCLGNYKTLSTKMVTDNVMLAYLNNNENNRANPNENFAREFFELFTIGKGPEIGPGDYTYYTEHDIVEAARLFTGFRTMPRGQFIDPDHGIPSGRGFSILHDTGNKTFSSKFDNKTIQGGGTVSGMYAELDAFVNMIFDKEQTAKYLVLRLYRFFVSRHITADVEATVIEPLAQQFKNGGYEMMPILRTLFSSEHFYDADDSNNDDEIIGGLVKSPLDLALQAMSFFEVPIPSPQTQNLQHYVLLYLNGIGEKMIYNGGMSLFNPPDVAGYPAYYQKPELHRQWFNSSTVVARYKIPQMLLEGRQVTGDSPNRPLGTKLNIAPWVRNSPIFSDPSNAKKLVDELLEYLFPKTPDSARRDHYWLDVLLDGLPPADWTYEWNNYISSGNPTEVTIGLERLVKAIMNAPEYQLM